MKHFTESKYSLSKIAKEALIVGIIAPYICWAYFLLAINRAFIGSAFILDVVIVAFTGYCLFKRYLRRDKDETAKSRMHCLWAAVVAMAWIGFAYSLGTSWLVSSFLSTFVTTKWILLLSTILLKMVSLYLVYSLIDPDGEKLVSGRYSEEYDMGDAEDDTIVT